MAAKIRVYELARELGLTNKETLDLCIELGIQAKSHSSSIEDAQADRVRRKADQLGMRRDVQPEEPPKKGAPGTKAEDEEAAPAAQVARNRLDRLRLEFKSRQENQSVKMGTYEQKLGLKEGSPRRQL